MMPAHWKTCQLKTVAKIQTGIAKGKKDVEDPIELPYLRVANVQDGYLDLREIKKILVSKDQVDRYLLRAGDIVLTEGGDFDKLGRGTVWRGQIQPCLHQNHVFVVRTKSSALLPEFFSYQISSLYGKKYFLSCAKQTTSLASINSTQLSEFPVLFPPIHEQKRIVEILATWDEAIALMERAIEAKKKRQEFLLKYLLPKNIQSGWQQFNLAELSTKPISYGIVQTGEPVKGGVFCVRVIDLTARELDPQRMITTSKEISQSYRRTILEEGELMLALRGEIGLVRLVGRKLVGCNLTRGVARISPNKSLVVSEYLLWALRSPLFRDNLLKRVNGSALQEIPITELRKVVVPVPSIEKQQAIARLLDATAQEIELIQAQLHFLRVQKRGLMQKLLTGEWRTAVQEAA